MLVGNSELECSEVKQLKFIQFKEDHILKILQDLKVDKAAGPDGISPRILWETKFLITCPLRFIFEKSFTEGIIPNDWKQAVVIPIFKNGKKDVLQNYGPISLTCIVCKVMKSVIKEALLKHLFSNQLISEQQYGFVPGQSCTLQLLACIEEWSSLGGHKPFSYVAVSFSPEHYLMCSRFCLVWTPLLWTWKIDGFAWIFVCVSLNLVTYVFFIQLMKGIWLI